MAQAVELKVVLVLLPANYSHLIQTLDTSLFHTFKSVLHRFITIFMIFKGNNTLTNKDVLKISNEA